MTCYDSRLRRARKEASFIEYTNLPAQPAILPNTDPSRGDKQHLQSPSKRLPGRTLAHEKKNIKFYITLLKSRPPCSVMSGLEALSPLKRHPRNYPLNGSFKGTRTKKCAEHPSKCSFKNPLNAQYQAKAHFSAKLLAGYSTLHASSLHE